MPRTLTLTIALDWPETAGDGKVLVDAIRAEFKATKEERFRGPRFGIALSVYSTWLAGNGDLPRIWRRMIRYLEKASIITHDSDPWCYGMRVYEVDREPHIVVSLTEER